MQVCFLCGHKLCAALCRNTTNRLTRWMLNTGSLLIIGLLSEYAVVQGIVKIECKSILHMKITLGMLFMLPWMHDRNAIGSNLWLRKAAYSAHLGKLSIDETHSKLFLASIDCIASTKVRSSLPAKRAALGPKCWHNFLPSAPQP